jgi:hypothetical protein
MPCWLNWIEDQTTKFLLFVESTTDINESFSGFAFLTSVGTLPAQVSFCVNLSSPGQNLRQNSMKTVYYRVHMSRLVLPFIRFRQAANERLEFNCVII